MDTTRYSKWGGSSEEVPGGPWGRWVHWSRRPLFLALAVLVATVLWAVILSILLSKASTERAALLDGHDLLRTNASKQTAALGALKEEVGDCHSCCSGTQAQLQTTRAELGEAQAKLMEQESALRELRERDSCEPCPTSWLSFEGSCYFFSVPKTTWAAAQGHCADASAHLVIVGGLDEQGFLTRNTRGRGYWLGLRAVRHLGKVQGYQWVDGVSLSFSHWNKGEPNDAWGRENCVMMLHTGLWNDAPCDSEKDGWICEKRRNC
ncbi:CLEC4G isoform 2 [Pan troglodytes]|uniref:CLEC4G isoform 2 n=1 Tax=Pan troglodytes TaxID=9598 RepID=A0A2J8J6D1_PANTR|nr:CLEC4G isoform 2 [Pan troglodytes]